MTLWSRLAGAQDYERGDQVRQGHRRGVELRVRAGDYAGVGAKRVCLRGDGWLGGVADKQVNKVEDLVTRVVTKRYPTCVSSKLCEFFSSPWASLNHCYVISKDNLKVLAVVVRKTRIYAASFPITMIYARYNKHRPSSKCSCLHFHHNKHRNPVFNSCFRSNP